MLSVVKTSTKLTAYKHIFNNKHSKMFWNSVQTLLTVTEFTIAKICKRLVTNR